MAGCISGEPDGKSPDASSAEVGSASTGAPEEENATAERVIWFPVNTPFTFTGKTGTWFCLPSAPNSCSGHTVSDSENTFQELVYEGEARSVTGTLTWSATTPATEELSIGIFAVTSCGDGCIESGDDSYGAWAGGPSPLELSATDIVLREGESLWVHVGGGTVGTPPPAFAFASFEQEFSFEGAIASEVATPEPAAP